MPRNNSAISALTVQASTTELGKLFQIFTMRAEKNAFVNHNERYRLMILQFIVVALLLALSLRGRSGDTVLSYNMLWVFSVVTFKFKYEIDRYCFVRTPTSVFSYFLFTASSPMRKVASR